MPLPVSSRRTTVQTASRAVGAFFLLVGFLGFVPGVTMNLDRLTVAGWHSDAALLGVFTVSVLHNVVHLALGVAGLAFASTVARARGYLVGGGLIYLVLFLYRSLIDREAAMNVVPANSADTWLHLGFAVAMLGLGALPGSRRGPDAPPANRVATPGEFAP